MGLFDGFMKQTPQGFLGVDVGSSGFKIVELGGEKGRPKLMTYGYSEPAPGEIIQNPFENTTAGGELLAFLCKKSGTKATQAMAALPASSVFSAIIAVPRKSTDGPRELKPLIDAQIAKLAPLPLADMVTYSTFIDDLNKKPVVPAPAPAGLPKKQEYARVLVTGAAKSLVQKYLEIFRTAKLELKAIDSEAFALIRSLVGKDKSTIALLDIGSKRTNITIVEKGIPFVTRSINIGGSAVTRRLMDQMKVSEEQAEQMKRDLSSVDNGGGMPAVLEAVVQPVLNEIKYAFQLFANMELTESKRVEKIILTGGSAHLPQLPEALKQALGLNVYRGDPWARVLYPADLRPVLDEIGPRMSVAVGLAMRDLE